MEKEADRQRQEIKNDSNRERLSMKRKINREKNKKRWIKETRRREEREREKMRYSDWNVREER